MLVFSIVAAILSIWFLAVSVNDTWNNFTPAERENWRNLGMALTRKIPGNISTAVGWLASSGISFFAYRAQIRSERREEELKNAFGRGLWGGYAINFFGRAVQELRAAGITPIIVFVSPSYRMIIDTTYDYRQFLKDLPSALERRGITLTPTAAQIGFRVSQQFDYSVGGTERRVIIDLPTTFASFLYGLDRIIQARKAIVSPDRQERLFDDFKLTFFNEIQRWRGITYKFDYLLIPINRPDADEFADRIVQCLANPMYVQGEIEREHLTVAV